MVGCVSVKCDVTIANTAGGSVITPGEGTFTYDEGEVVNLVATPDAGYQFVNWTGDVDDIANVEDAATTITMNDYYSIAASFVKQQYDLTTSSTASGSVTMPGEGTFTYDEGEVVNLLAEAEEGYQFVNWTGNVGTIANINAASTTITMNGSYSITANFEAILAGQYSLTISSTAGGSVTMPGEGTFICDAGTVVSLAATPATGYQFVNWTGDVDTIDNVESASTTVSMNGGCSITANFEPIPTVRYDLTITSTGGGWVINPGKGTFTYDAGTLVSLVAFPASGYGFVNWTGDMNTIENADAASTTITMNDNYSIRANFKAIPASQYSLTISSTDGGSVTMPGEGTFICDAGTVVSLVAIPATGYQFVNWTGNVGTIANVNAASTTITMSGAYSITANFEAIPTGQYSLTTSSTSGGSVTVPGEGAFTCDAGTVVSLVATPDVGYQFVNWTGNVGTIANVNAASTTITMNDSYSIRADFSEDSVSPPGISYTEAEAEALIIVLVNDERQQSGLPTLSEDPLLTSLAREHSTSMVENNFFGHQRYPGERSFSYGQPPGTIRGENIAMIPTRRVIPGPYLSLQEVCEWAVSAWMSSSGHRENILEPRYNKTGVGVSFSEGGEYLYITQMFEGAY